jgi:hypothetical protein
MGVVPCNRLAKMNCMVTPVANNIKPEGSYCRSTIVRSDAIFGETSLPCWRDPEVLDSQIFKHTIARNLVLSENTTVE